MIFFTTAFAFLFFISASTEASDKTDLALKLVPGGKVVEERAKEIKVLTGNNSLVEIEFKQDGSFEEASGEDVSKDVFVPPMNLLPLSSAIAALKKEGKAPAGEWSLEQSFMKGWHYEFEGLEDGRKMDYVVDAKAGKIVSATIDD